MNTLHGSGGEVSINVNGRPVRLYHHEGKSFIESRDGTEYTIKIVNARNSRIEVVAAVDGLSVLTGELASSEDRGYVVGAYGTLEIKGFRKSDAEVGAFKFTTKAGSYAGSKGEGTNVGVIAVKVFSENVPYHNAYGFSLPRVEAEHPTPYWLHTPTYTSSGMLRSTGLNTLDSTTTTGVLNSQTTYFSNSSFVNCSANCSEAVPFSHGTTWGQRITDKVVSTDFNRLAEVQTIEIFYNSAENLTALGIKLQAEKQIVYPSSFPRDFAKPPVGWKG